MAAITGITGMQIGDGAGNKVALSIEERMLRILYDRNWTWRFATAENPQTIKAGTAYFRVPEIIESGSDYGSGNITYDTPQVGGKKIDIDKRQYAAYEYELFDVERILDSDAIMGQIATSLAQSVEATLNATFWLELTNQMKTDATLKTQAIALNVLGENYATTPFDPDEAYQDVQKINYQIVQMSTIYDKTMMGVPKAEISAILSPTVDAGIAVAFRNQPNAIGTWQVAPSLVGKQIMNLKYITDNMLDQNIAANQSFNKTAIDLTNLLGVLYHNEAIAMPINYKGTFYLPNPNNANPRFLVRWQYGFGILRPKLIYGLYRAGHVPSRNK